MELNKASAVCESWSHVCRIKMTFESMPTNLVGLLGLDLNPKPIELDCFHKNKLEEIFCQLDSIQILRSFNAQLP